MSEVVDYDDPSGSHLTEKDKTKLVRLMKEVRKLIDNIAEPIDPKVAALLEIAWDCLDTQHKSEMHFSWVAEIPTEVDEEDVRKAVEEVRKDHKWPSNDSKKKKKQEPDIKKPNKSKDNDTPTVEDLESWLG